MHEPRCRQWLHGQGHSNNDRYFRAARILLGCLRCDPLRPHGRGNGSGATVRCDQDEPTAVRKCPCAGGEGSTPSPLATKSKKETVMETSEATPAGEAACEKLSTLQ